MKTQAIKAWLALAPAFKPRLESYELLGTACLESS